MSFFQRLRESLARFMQGRHGADNLGMFTLIAGLACSLYVLFQNYFHDCLLFFCYLMSSIS